MKTILLAIGGNSLIRAGEKGSIAEQIANARRTAAQVVGLCRSGYRIVLTHGNGPQVGAALLRSERAASQVPGQPLMSAMPARRAKLATSCSKPCKAS